MNDYMPEEIIDNLQYALVKMADTCQDLEEERDELAEMCRRLTASVPKKSNDKVLTSGDVKQIRRESARGLHSQAEIARTYGVNPATISRIVRGVYYADVR